MGVSDKTSGLDDTVQPSDHGAARETSSQPQESSRTGGVSPRLPDVLSDALPSDNGETDALAGDAGLVPDGWGTRAGRDEETYPSIILPKKQDATLNKARLRTVLLLLQVVIDAAMLVGALVLGYLVRTYIPILSPPVDPPSFMERYLPITIVHTLSVLTVFYFSQMYHLKQGLSRFDNVWRIMQHVSSGTVIAIAVETLAFQNSELQFDYPRGVIVYTWLFSVLLIVVGRELHQQLVMRLQRAQIGRDNVIIVGHNDVTRSIIKNIRDNSKLGYDIVGVVTETGEGKVAKTQVIGMIEDLPTLIDAYNADQVIVAIPDATRKELGYIVSLCQRGRVEIRIYPDNFSFIAGTITVDQLVGLPLLSVRDVALRGWRLSLKRAVDFFGSGVGLVVLSPILLLLAFLVWRHDRGPVFFVQERVGLDGKPFPMIKFRTMIINAEEKARWTVAGDDRVTPIGKFMRPRNLDELPQLFNVFYGQMSLVGPRPEQVNFVEAFNKQYRRYSERHREKAGMTGWAQVNGYRGDTSIEDRLRADLYYVENWSLWLDIQIIIRTIWQTVTGRSPNAY